jgi:Mg2+ and Co2+ transporter CorA
MSPHRAAASHLPGLVPGIALAVTNVAAWLASIDLGVVASSVSLLIIALGTALAVGYQKFTDAKIEATRKKTMLDIELSKAREEAAKGSLQASINQQTDIIKQIQVRLEDANDKLHKEKNERQASELRHTEELQRLTERHTEESNRLTEHIKIMTAEVHELRDEVRQERATRQMYQKQYEELLRNQRELPGRVAEKLVELGSQSDFPAYRPDAPATTTPGASPVPPAPGDATHA